jgi:twitching motility two-component system response regulator PilH
MAAYVHEDPIQEARKHIFVINGAPEFLNLMRDIFQDQRFNVTTTNFVPNSFAQIAALQPDALIVDIVVGQKAGWDLLERLHDGVTTTGIPVVVVSTSSRLLDEAREQAGRFGTHRYLVKPFDLDALMSMVEEMIGEA